MAVVSEGATAASTKVGKVKIAVPGESDEQPDSPSVTRRMDLGPPSDSDRRYWTAAESAAVVGASPPGVATPSAPTIAVDEAPLGAIATAGLGFVPHASSVPKNISPQFTEPIPTTSLSTAAVSSAHFELSPQPPVQDIPVASSRRELDRSMRISMSGGTGAATGKACISPQNGGLLPMPTAPPVPVPKVPPVPIGDRPPSDSPPHPTPDAIATATASTPRPHAIEAMMSAWRTGVQPSSIPAGRRESGASFRAPRPKDRAHRARRRREAGAPGKSGGGALTKPAYSDKPRAHYVASPKSLSSASVKCLFRAVREFKTEWRRSCASL